MSDYSELQAGDIVFCRDWGPISWFIRRQQGDFDYSHVCLVGENGSCLYSTGAYKLLWFGRIDDLGHYFQGKAIAVRRYEGLTPEQASLILGWCHSQVGKNRYPLMKVALLTLKGLMGRMVRNVVKEDPKTVHDTFCAESVALAYQAAGILLTPQDNMEPDAYTPEIVWYDPHLTKIYESGDNKEA